MLGDGAVVVDRVGAVDGDGERGTLDRLLAALPPELCNMTYGGGHDLVRVEGIVTNRLARVCKITLGDGVAGVDELKLDLVANFSRD